jgi:hypothetical protein
MVIKRTAKKSIKISGKEFVLYYEYPTKLGAEHVAARIRNEVPDKGYLVKVIKIPLSPLWGVYIHDGTKKPWRMQS